VTACYRFVSALPKKVTVVACDCGGKGVRQMSAIGTHRLSRRVPRHFRCWSLTGTATAVPIFLSLTQCMVRPCVARGLVDLSVCGLASMYPASDWSVCAPGHHGHQRAYVLISRQASSEPFGSPGFACAVKTDPPSRLNLSQTSAGNGKVMLRHRCLVYRCSSFVRAIRLFLRPGLQ
jgi:hypothetical protein